MRFPYLDFSTCVSTPTADVDRTQELRGLELLNELGALKATTRQARRTLVVPVVHRIENMNSNSEFLFLKQLLAPSSKARSP